MYGPSNYLTSNNRYAQTLQRAPNANNGTMYGGLANVLQQGLTGYYMGEDRQDLEAANAAMQSENPQANLNALQGNEYAGRMAQMLQAEERKRSNAREDFIWQQENTESKYAKVAREIGLKPGTQQYEEFMRGAALANTQAGQEKFSNTPIWGTDENGRPVLMQTSNRGGVKQVDLPPGVTPERGQTSRVDLGDAWGILDANGTLIGRMPKGVAPETKIDLANNRTVTTPPVNAQGQPGWPQAQPGQSPQPQDIPSVTVPPASPGTPPTVPPAQGAPTQGGQAPAQQPAPDQSAAPQQGAQVQELPPTREDTLNAESAVSKAQRGLDQLSALKTHPGMPGMVGWPGTSVSGWTSQVPLVGGPIRGTPEADFQARINQIEGSAFLEAFESLKGGGQITEIEGRKGTDAITRIANTSPGEREWLQAVQDLEEVIRAGMDRARSRGQLQSPPQAPAPAGNVDDIMKMYGG